MGDKLHALRVAVWGEAPATKEERALLRKIDFFILTYCCVAFFFNYLDRAALANAYVSGMREDIGLYGTQYNALVTCLAVGYIVGQVPHGIVIQVVAPRIWFPLMTVLAAVRFFQGVAEASTYSGTQYIIGSWYKPQEVAKRVGLFSAAGMAGTMFAGIMMTAIWETMNGHLGLPGWRWVFIIDGIITLPIAIFGFVYFPDLPETTKASYLKPHERELALARLPPKRADGHRIGFSLVKRVLFTVNFWVFTWFWILGGALEAFSTQSCMVLWMRASGDFTVPQNNNYPLGITAIGILVTLVTAVAIDATGKIMPFGFVAVITQLITCVVLLNWSSIGNSGKMGAYYLAGSAYLIQPVVFTWATKVLSRNGDDAARAVTLYAMNGASSVLFSFWGITLYPATDAATGFHKGTVTMIVVAIFLTLNIFAVWWQDKRTAHVTMPGNELESQVKVEPCLDETKTVKGAVNHVNES